MVVSERLCRIVANVFGIQVDDVEASTSPDNIARWDSLQHLNLIVALEEEFGISIGPDESSELLTVGIIQLFLEEKGVLVSE